MEVTTFNEIYQWFLDKITDLDILKFDENNREKVLYGCLQKSCVIFADYCSEDILLRNIELKQFNNKLSEKVIDILSDAMVLFWLKPKLNHWLLLKDSLNTTDFTKYSKANMLSKVKELYNETELKLELKMNSYTYSNKKFSNLRNTHG